MIRLKDIHRNLWRKYCLFLANDEIRYMIMTKLNCCRNKSIVRMSVFIYLLAFDFVYSVYINRILHFYISRHSQTIHVYYLSVGDFTNIISDSMTVWKFFWILTSDFLSEQIDSFICMPFKSFWTLIAI